MPGSKLWCVIVISLSVLSTGALLRPAKVQTTASAEGTWPTHLSNLQSESHEQLKEAVVVTLHKLSPGVRELLSDLHRSLVGGKRALWALVDGKRATPAMLQEVGNYIGDPQRAVTVKYQSMLHKIFPHASQKQKRSFNIFEGMHHSPAKPGAVWFLAEGPGTWYEFVWVLESDVRLVQGNWAHFFDQYSQRRSDLVSVIDQPKRWGNWRGCTHPGCFGVARQRSFLPVFRLSRRLARRILESLRHGRTGHHEAFLHAVCREERRWQCIAEDLEQSSSYGKITFSQPLPHKLIPGKIYHPIKSA